MGIRTVSAVARLAWSPAAPPPAPVIASSSWTERDWADALDERAAIHEHVAGLNRVAAERAAREEIAAMQAQALTRARQPRMNGNECIGSR